MWIVSQIGAREHYSVPRALQQSKQLGALLTDFWIPPRSPISYLPGGQKLRDRHHPNISPELVWAPNQSSLLFEVKQRIRKDEIWSTIQKRDHSFQQHAIPQLHRLANSLTTDAQPTLFSYSYAARDLFREAKELGWKTILGQIDPGPGEHALVGRLADEFPEWNSFILPQPPPSYWDDWREESELADEIIVNSSWSAKLISESGISANKMRVIPLAYESKAQEYHEKNYNNRPLRLLFLGQAIVRKGIHDLVATASNLDPKDWHIDVVGPHPPLPNNLPETITFHGPSPRSEVSKWYARSDIFVLPTHSDGFGITQLEAMAYGLPVIATLNCGEVVEEDRNGWIIPVGSPNALTDLLQKIVVDKEQLITMSESARNTLPRFSLKRIGEALLQSSNKS
jgi:glycosyltransferase involved in cell wall biosynthesis